MSDAKISKIGDIFDNPYGSNHLYAIGTDANGRAGHKSMVWTGEYGYALVATLFRLDAENGRIIDTHTILIDIYRIAEYLGIATGADSVNNVVAKIIVLSADCKRCGSASQMRHNSRFFLFFGRRKHTQQILMIRAWGAYHPLVRLTHSFHNRVDKNIVPNFSFFHIKSRNIAIKSYM